MIIRRAKKSFTFIKQNILLLLVSFFGLATGCTTKKEPIKIPTATEVGAQVMPDTIAAIKAPFTTTTFAKPVFPDRSINILEQGAKEGEQVTHIIQTAIDQISAAGGGRVIIPKGIWKTGRISLKSHVNLHLAAGAALYFSGEIKDYLPAVFTRNEGIELYSLGACIYANGQQHIAITGKGKLIGPADGSVRKQIMTHDVIENVVPLDKPVHERIYEGKNGAFIFPPMFIAPINCKDVYIEGISLENTAFWNIVPQYCDQVIIRGVTIQSVGIPRGDGIDIESSKNVLVEYCTFMTGDDCLAMKAGRGWDGLRVNKPTENVVVRYCLAKSGHGGITIGSETAGMIRNLYVHDCVFDNEGIGIRFKTRRPRGGGGEKLYYERIRMRVGQTALRWDMLGSAKHVGAAADRNHKVAVNPLTPHLHAIQIKDMIVEEAEQFIEIDGIPEAPLSNVKITGITAHSQKLFDVKDAQQIWIENSQFTSPDTVLRASNAADIVFKQVLFNIPAKALTLDVPNAEAPAIRLEQVNYTTPK